MHLLSVRDQIKHKIVGEMQSLADRMTSGSAHDYAAYRQLCGRMQGLKDGLECVDAVFNKLLNEGEDD